MKLRLSRKAKANQNNQHQELEEHVAQYCKNKGRDTTKHQSYIKQRLQESLSRAHITDANNKPIFKSKEEMIEGLLLEIFSHQKVARK